MSLIRWQSMAGRIAVLAVATIALNTTDALAQNAAKKRAPSTFNILPINISSVTVQGGQLVANGTVGLTPIQLPLTMAAQPLAPGATCPVLDLSLGPINLSLLGLNVDTSPICLEITATQGGGLLGDLLCAIGNLLNSGVPLADILAQRSTADLATLNSGLTTVLNQVLNQVTSSNAFLGATCNILNLSIGPLDLSILGLNVALDDCDDGPVTVDITATQGGGLLGDLLCSLAGNQNPNAIATILRNLVRVLGGIIG